MQAKTQNPPTSFPPKAESLSLVETDKNLSVVFGNRKQTAEEYDDARFDQEAIDRWVNEGGH